MSGLEINRGYLDRLVLKVRAVMAPECPGIPDEGSNPADDIAGFVLQDMPDNLTREELREEIEGLGPEKQAELVALMWMGRDDLPASQWEELVRMAEERRERPASDYLLDHPLLAEYWKEALNRLDAEGKQG